MEIKTKFDVGQEVWAILIDREKGVFLVHQLEIGDIEIEVDKDGTMIWYHDGEWNHRSYKESDLFATRAEAQAECDRRNGEKGETL